VNLIISLVSIVVNIEEIKQRANTFTWFLYCSKTTGATQKYTLRSARRSGAALKLREAFKIHIIINFKFNIKLENKMFQNRILKYLKLLFQGLDNIK
jgi:hypothetical protein